ncbi:hypothetical protein ACTFIW_010727 [Dictyostelium discoideum]
MIIKDNNDINYYLYKKVFNNKYLKTIIFQFVKDLNVQAIESFNKYTPNDPRKRYNEITFHWIVKNRKYEILKDMVKCSFQSTIFFFKSELSLIIDLESFLKYFNNNSNNNNNDNDNNNFNFLNNFYRIHKNTLLSIQSLDLIELSIISNNLSFLKIVLNDNNGDNNNYNNHSNRSDLINIALQNGVNIEMLKFLKEEMGLTKYDVSNALINIVIALNNINNNNNNNQINNNNNNNNNNFNNNFKFLIENLFYQIDKNDFYQISELSINVFLLDTKLFQLLINPIIDSISLDFILKLLSNYLNDYYSTLETFSKQIILNFFYIFKIIFKNSKTIETTLKIINSNNLNELEDKEIKKLFIFNFLYKKGIKENLKEKDKVRIGFQYILKYKEFEFVKKIIRNSTTTTTTTTNNNNDFLYKYGIRLACENFELFKYLYYNFKENFLWNDKLVGGFIANRGDLEFMKFIHQNGVDGGLNKLIDNNFIMENAVTSDSLALVQYLTELNIYPISSLVPIQALRHKRDEIFLYLLDNRNDPIDINLNAIHHNLEIVKRIKSRLLSNQDKLIRYNFKGIPPKNLNNLISQLDLILLKPYL